MRKKRVMRNGLILLLLCLLASQVHAGEVSTASGVLPPVPVPEGRELSDAELLEVEGELGFLLSLLLLTGIGAAAGAGSAAIHENWFDEDYGIDRDDLREIGSAAVTGAIGGAAGGFGARFVPV